MFYRIIQPIRGYEYILLILLAGVCEAGEKLETLTQRDATAIFFSMSRYERRRDDDQVVMMVSKKKDPYGYHHDLIRCCFTFTVGAG
jgi:hypothetical protein